MADTNNCTNFHNNAGRESKPRCTNCDEAGRECLCLKESQEWPLLQKLVCKDKLCVIQQIEAALCDGQKVKEQVTFLTKIINSFRQETPHDILVKSGKDNEPPIPAHRAIFSSNSPILKNMVMDSSSTDSCKASSTPNETLTFPELNHDELKILLDFFYEGESAFVDDSDFMKHVTSLFLAAHKYDITTLEDFCESKMVASLNEENVFGFLESSESVEISGNNKLKDAAMEFIKENNHVVHRSQFVDFAKRNHLLSVEVTRACVSYTGMRRRGKRRTRWIL